MDESFLLRIEKQGWIGTKEDDLCSHGEIYLNVNGTIITQAGIDENWGISESALALLRTINNNYISDPVNKEGLILHGCGLILMISCPISIHWSVKHHGEQVILSDFVKVMTTNPETGSKKYPGLIVNLSKEDYRNKILSFARHAKMLFDCSIDKQIVDEYEREIYIEFWDEYNKLLNEA